MTPGLFMHSSNRLEELARLLAGMLREESGSILDRRSIVVVQTPGVARWLSLRLADLLGCCMGVEFLFPRNFVDRMSAALLGGDELSHPDRVRMTWRIFSLLPELAEAVPDGVLHAYLSGACTLGRYQLARQVADLFDQYLIHRPELIAGWEAGAEPGDWQAELWRRLSEQEPMPHLASEMPRIEAAMPEAGVLPERVFLFALSTLPPLYVHLLNLLGRHMRVDLFLLAPSREYWGDTPGRRESVLAAESGEALDYVQPLLASMGEQGRDFFNLLVDEGGGFDPDRGVSCYVDPDSATTLGRLQGELLDLRISHDALPEPVDGSLVVAKCGGPMREIEVLRDHILSLLDADRSLRPRDILVMMPKLSDYASCIEAVFGGEEDPAIPFALADGRPRDEPVPDAFLRLLSLVPARRTVRDVMDFIGNPSVAARFGLDAEALEKSREMAVETGVRWGLDGEDRERLGFGAEVRNSWKAGLDSLVLGAMMWGGEGTRFDEVSPYPFAEGENLLFEAGLVEAVSAVTSSLRTLETERPLSEWPDVLAQCVDSLICPEEDSEGARTLLSAIETLRNAAGSAGGDPVDVRTIRAVMGDLLEDSPTPHGFLSGGVTFAELKPMRSVPAKVICVLGMDDESFPRQDRPLSFDRIRLNHKLGDRSVRAADRYLFLETLLCAREHLYISYGGLSPTGGAERPPSVVVSELLEYLLPGSSDAFVRTQPLQAFSSRCFLPGLPDGSYSRQNFNAALAAAGRHSEPVFLAEPLSVADAGPDVLDLEELIAFLIHPAGYFLTRVLGMEAPKRDERIPESEPQRVSGLDLYRERDRIVRAALEGGEVPVSSVGSGGILPWGLAGAAAASEIASESLVFSRSVRALLDGPEGVIQGMAGPFAGGLNLRIRIGSVYKNRVASFHCAKFKPKDRVQAWVEAIAVGALREEGLSGGGLPVGVSCLRTDQRLDLSIPEGASEKLASLVRLFRAGQVRPLPLFEESSFAAAVSESKTKKTPTERALDLWAKRDASRGPAPERDDPLNRLAFLGCDPLEQDADTFLELAHAMWDGYAECVESGGAK